MPTHAFILLVLLVVLVMLAVPSLASGDEDQAEGDESAGIQISSLWDLLLFLLGFDEASLSQKKSSASSKFVVQSLLFTLRAGLASMIFRLAWQLATAIYDRIVVTATVLSFDDAFIPIMRKIRNVGRSNAFLVKTEIQKYAQRYDQKRVVELLPGSGTHIINFEGTTIWAVRSVKDTLNIGWERRPEDLESITLTAMGRGAGDKLRKFIAEANREGVQHHRGKQRIYTMRRWGFSWDLSLVADPRPWDSVVLAEGLGDELVSDAEQFLASQDWYRERGIPWRRGYLLHGPPGTGKSSTAVALAGKLNLHVCVLTLASKDLSDAALSEYLRRTPRGSLVLLEDVDAVFVKREAVQQGGRGPSRGGGVTFAGLINALDGVASHEGRLLVMTTNHLERLDEALIRPGRCDLVREISFATRDQARRMFGRFYGQEAQGPAGDEANASSADPADAAAGLRHRGGQSPGLLTAPRLARSMSQDFVDLLPNEVLTPAQLQAFFLRHRDAPDEALRNIRDLTESKREEERGEVDLSRWLRRLGLGHTYAERLQRARIHRVPQLLALGDSEMEQAGIDIRAHRKRIGLAKSGDQQVLSEMNGCSPSKAQAIFLHWFATRKSKVASTALAALAAQFAEGVPDAHTLSVAQIMRVCALCGDDAAAASGRLAEEVLRSQVPSLGAVRQAMEQLRGETSVDDTLNGVRTTAGAEEWLEPLGLLPIAPCLDMAGVRSVADIAHFAGERAPARGKPARDLAARLKKLLPCGQVALLRRVANDAGCSVVPTDRVAEADPAQALCVLVGDLTGAVAVGRALFPRFDEAAFRQQLQAVDWDSLSRAGGPVTRGQLQTALELFATHGAAGRAARIDPTGCVAANRFALALQALAMHEPLEPLPLLAYVGFAAPNALATTPTAAAAGTGGVGSGALLRSPSVRAAGLSLGSSVRAVLSRRGLPWVARRLGNMAETLKSRSLPGGRSVADLFVHLPMRSGADGRTSTIVATSRLMPEALSCIASGAAVSALCTDVALGLAPHLTASELSSLVEEAVHGDWSVGQVLDRLAGALERGGGLHGESLAASASSGDEGEKEEEQKEEQKEAGQVAGSAAVRAASSPMRGLLARLGLDEYGYADRFESAGLETVEDAQGVTDEQLASCVGVGKVGHRRLIQLGIRSA